MPENNLPVKKSFDKDVHAAAIVNLMCLDDFSDLPDTYKAQQIGLTVEEYRSYMTDPNFLNWASKRLIDLHKSRLPGLLNVMFKQAMEGKGRQQKMLLDLMGVGQKQEETKSPNIVIITNIPNPDETKQVIEVLGGNDARNNSV